VGGGLCGTIVASMSQAMRYGVARGVFSNEAGMGSAAITAAAATTTDPVRQGYINMTGTFWDTIVVCTITGLCIASSGVLGSTAPVEGTSYSYIVEESESPSVLTLSTDDGTQVTTELFILGEADDSIILSSGERTITLTPENACDFSGMTYSEMLVSGGSFRDASDNEYIFSENGDLEYREIVVGAALTIAAFESVLGTPGGWLVCIGIALFAFSTILGWEYHGEKAFEYLFGTHRYNMIYRIIFSLIVYVGATTTLEIAWNFSDIANALMAIPNLICLLALSGVIAQEMERYQAVIAEEKAAKKAAK
jgi:AGCS family alanine or glycine:cation symporter